MKVADYVIHTLGDFGVSEMFVVYGGANGDLIDAFTRTNQTRYIAVQHEQSGGHALEGWAKVKGLPGVAIATSGPGAQNFVTAIANCYYDSVPAIFLTGQVKTAYMRNDESIRQVGFQETDIVGIAKPITKYATLVINPSLVRYELEKAWFIAQEGRPGPVLLDLPVDVQKSEIEPKELSGYISNVSGANTFNIEIVSKQIDAFLNDLSLSQRPAFLIGGGVRTSGVQKLFRTINEILQIPSFPTWNALDVITSDYEYYGGRVGTFGGADRNFGIQNCDLLLSIGSRISGRITGGNPKTFVRAAKKYIVDVDKTLLQPA